MLTVGLDNFKTKGGSYSLRGNVQTQNSIFQIGFFKLQYFSCMLTFPELKTSLNFVTDFLHWVMHAEKFTM